MKTILYIGNKLQGSVMEVLSKQLEAHFQVVSTSEHPNKVLRALEMLGTFFRVQHRTDLVILDTYSTLNFYYAWGFALLCRFFRKPYLCYLHGGNLPARLTGSPRMSRAVFGHAQANVAPSGYLKSALEQAGFNAICIPNFIRIERYPFVQRARLRPNLLWVRAFERTYHPEMSIRVFAAIQKTYPEAQLCMVGPDKDGSMERCKLLVARLGLGHHVQFPGQLTKAKWIELSADYDIFLSTPHFDNTPVSVVEAMALGLPVVSTGVGGMPYLIEHGKDGLLSPDADEAAMIRHLQLLLTDPYLAGSLSRNARQKAENFDWKMVEKQWLELIRQAP